MKQNVILIVVALVLFSNAIKAQTALELDQVTQVPSIDETNMNIISSSIQLLFEDALKNPSKYSTIRASEDTVYTFYDSDEDRKLHKINPETGKQFTAADSSDLRKNQISLYWLNKKFTRDVSLFFNLNFDEKGNLIVPNTISVILFRTEDVRRNGNTYIEHLGRLAFELEINDSLKRIFSKVHLEKLAKKDVNSLTGGLSPVPIKLPFVLKYGTHNGDEVTGHAIKKGNEIAIRINRYFKDQEEEEHFVKLLKEQTDILTYKKGEFDFTIVEKNQFCNCQLNIVADNIIANRISKASSQGYSTKMEEIIAFTGDGKKTKN